jgi:hypothetical protein
MMIAPCSHMRQQAGTDDKQEYLIPKIALPLQNLSSET